MSLPSSQPHHLSTELRGSTAPPQDLHSPVPTPASLKGHLIQWAYLLGALACGRRLVAGGGVVVVVARGDDGRGLTFHLRNAFIIFWGISYMDTIFISLPPPPFPKILPCPPLCPLSNS